MLTVILILLSLVAVLLIGVILIQESKGGGISSAAFGGMGGQMGSMFGATRSADFIQKLTYWLMVFIAVAAIVANMAFVGKTVTTSSGSALDGLTPTAAPMMNSAPAPTGEQAPAAEPAAQPAGEDAPAE